MTALYVSQLRPRTFVDEAIAEGVGPASRRFLKFATLFLDYDLYGRLDLLSCNGHLEDEIAKIQASQKGVLDKLNALVAQVRQRLGK